MTAAEAGSIRSSRRRRLGAPTSTSTGTSTTGPALLGPLKECVNNLMFNLREITRVVLFLEV